MIYCSVSKIAEKKKNHEQKIYNKTQQTNKDIKQSLMTN